MEEAIQKADTLIEALGWIRRFRDKITVIKLGGSVMEHESALRHVLLDIVFMETVGMRPVVVHGGGAAIDRAMDAAGLVPKKIKGRRYTDEATLEIVERVLAYETNERLAGQIEELGGRAMPLNFRTTNVLFGERMTLPGDDGQPIVRCVCGRRGACFACRKFRSHVDAAGSQTKFDSNVGGDVYGR